MVFQPDSFTPDLTPDDASILAMKAALRDLQVSLRKPRITGDYPRRDEALAILADARVRIERINGTI